MKIPVGAIDCHMHHSPDVLDRRQWALDVARAAAKAGMGGVVLKSHHANTAGVARQVDRLVEGTKVMGGVALNDAVGGLNPIAIRMAGKFGARMAWMPTVSAANHIQYLEESSTMKSLRAGSEGAGLSILDENGRMLPVVDQILSEIQRADMGLATGHLSPQESIRLAEHAHARGFPMNRFLVTHADMPFTGLAPDEQAYVARLGGFLERIYMMVLSFHFKASPDALALGDEYTGESFYLPDEGLEHMLKGIRDTGCESSLFAGDLGQAGNPDPIDGIAEACRILSENGFSDEELTSMATEAPASFLGV